MNEKTMQHLADGLARLVRQHVSERLGPFQSKMDAHAAVNGEFNNRLAELEERLADAERKLALKVAA